MNLDDLPDLSGWRIIPIWTIKEAALIWSAVDPWDYADIDIFDLKGKLTLSQYKKALSFQRAACEDVCRGILPFEEAFEKQDDWQNGPWYKEVEFPEIPRHDRIAPDKTRITLAAIILWAKKKQILTYRQILEMGQTRSLVAVGTKADPDDAPDIQTLQLLGPPPFLDPQHPLASAEIRASHDAWNAIAAMGSPEMNGAEIKAAVRKFLDGHEEYKNFPEQAKDRVSTVTNGKKKGGPPRTPGQPTHLSSH